MIEIQYPEHYNGCVTRKVELHPNHPETEVRVLAENMQYPWKWEQRFIVWIYNIHQKSFCNGNYDLTQEQAERRFKTIL